MSTLSEKKHPLYHLRNHWNPTWLWSYVFYLRSTIMVTTSQNSLLIPAFTLLQWLSPCPFTLICMCLHTTRIPGLFPFIQFGFLILNPWTTSQPHTLKWWQYNICRRKFSMSLLTSLVTLKNQSTQCEWDSEPSIWIVNLIRIQPHSRPQGMTDFLWGWFSYSFEPTALPILLIMFLASAVSDKL